MEEKCNIKLLKFEPEEIIIIDDLSQEIQVAVKQERDEFEVKPPLQVLNAPNSLFRSLIKQESEIKEEATYVNDTDALTLKFELKSEEVHISLDDYDGDDIKPSRFTCNICGFKAICGEALRIHLTAHLREKPYKCNECDYSTSFKDIFRTHMLNHTHYYQRNELEEETPRRIKTNQKPFKCKKCNFNTNTKSVLKRHVVLSHCDKKLVECLTCGYKTPSKSNLRQHVRIHFPNRIKSFKCNACKSRFLHEGSLVRHMSVRPCKPGHS